MFVTINFASPTVAADSREQDVASKLDWTRTRSWNDPDMKCKRLGLNCPSLIQTSSLVEATRVAFEAFRPEARDSR
jgi:hypothetical protein